MAPLLFCSFCRKDQNNVAKLVAGPGVYICDGCIKLCDRAARGKKIPGFAGWDTLSEEQVLATLPAAAEAVRTVQTTLQAHVDLLRRRGVAWERIGEALGVSRQAAWERFSPEA